MRKKSRTSIQDVAAAAGVSAQTVSRVVNGSPAVSETTRQNVLALIESMGYRANMLGRSLLRGRTQTIGVVSSGIGLSGGMRILHGITRGANKASYALHLKGIDVHTSLNVEKVLDHLLQWQVDGILWAIPEIGANRDWLAQMPQLPVPMVMLSMQKRENCHAVSFNNYQGGLLATRHLLAQGRRCIAHMAGPQTWWEAAERKRGWEDALKEVGLIPNLWLDAQWDPEQATVGIAKLLQANPKIDAVFAGNDHMALGVLKEARKRGLKVPEDLAVIGFDNLPETAFYQPSLTSIEQDQCAIGELAIDMLIAQIEGKTLAPEIQAFSLTPRLILRNSA